MIQELIFTMAEEGDKYWFCILFLWLKGYNSFVFVHLRTLAADEYVART